MSDNNSIFRSAVMGGFHRQDVLSYLEAKARSHTEELNELGQRLDAAKKELTQVREELERTTGSLQELQAVSDSQEKELIALREELLKLREENSKLSDAANTSELELSAAIAERDRLALQVSEMSTQIEDIEQAKIRVANIELDAYARAKKIEDSAIENTNMARAALSNLYQDAKKRFELTKESTSETLLNMAVELEKLKEALLELPTSFDKISNEIDALKYGSEKKTNQPQAECSTEDQNAAEDPSKDEFGHNAFLSDFERVHSDEVSPIQAALRDINLHTTSNAQDPFEDNDTAFHTLAE